MYFVYNVVRWKKYILSPHTHDSSNQLNWFVIESSALIRRGIAVKSVIDSVVIPANSKVEPRPGDSPTISLLVPAEPHRGDTTPSLFLHIYIYPPHSAEGNPR